MKTEVPPLSIQKTVKPLLPKPVFSSDYRTKFVSAMAAKKRISDENCQMSKERTVLHKVINQMQVRSKLSDLYQPKPESPSPDRSTGLSIMRGMIPRVPRDKVADVSLQITCNQNREHKKKSSNRYDKRSIDLGSTSSSSPFLDRFRKTQDQKNFSIKKVLEDDFVICKTHEGNNEKIGTEGPEKQALSEKNTNLPFVSPTKKFLKNQQHPYAQITEVTEPCNSEVFIDSPNSSENLNTMLMD